MATIDLSDEELAVARAALESFLEEFSHEEHDAIKLIQRGYTKVGGDLSKTLTS